MYETFYEPTTEDLRDYAQHCKKYLWHPFFFEVDDLIISDRVLPRPWRRVYYRLPEMKFLDWRHVRYA